MNNKSNQSSDREENHSKKENPISTLDSRFNQTLRNVQGLLKGRSMPGKVLLTRRSNVLDHSKLQEPSLNYGRSFSFNDADTSDHIAKALEEEVESLSNPNNNANSNKLKSSTSNVENLSKGAQKSVMGARATDSTRVMKFTKVLSGTTVILEKLHELAWSGVPPYMRPDVWRLLLGYAPSNSDRREGVLRRKRLEYLDCASQYYDIPDTERSEDEINMLRQIAVDCPRTVPDVSFFQQEQVQKSLERILYTWAIRHPASGYVQGINDLVTPFLVVFLSEYLDGSVDNWSISDLSPDKISNIEADCYWCLSNLLEGMQDHYTFAQPGIQRLVFKLKEVVRRIDGNSHSLLLFSASCTLFTGSSESTNTSTLVYVLISFILVNFARPILNREVYFWLSLLLCVGVAEMWDRVKFWAALWASVTPVFKDLAVSSIMRDLLAVVK